jgi:hypothetical protein
MLKKSRRNKTLVIGKLVKVGDKYMIFRAMKTVLYSNVKVNHVKCSITILKCAHRDAVTSAGYQSSRLYNFD